MKYKYTDKAIQRGITVMVVLSILFLQSVNVTYALTVPTKAQAVGAVGNAVQNATKNAVTSGINSSVNSSGLASSGIAGKCASQVLQQKVTAYAAGAAITAIGAAFSIKEMVTNVPTGSMGISSGANLQSGEGGATTVLTWIKPMTDCLIHEASQLMIDNLNTAVNNAIMQGLNGNPNYSANANQFLSNLSAMIAGSLRNQINGLALCDFTGNGSFKQNLSNSIGLSTPQSSQQNFAKKIECPFPAGVKAQNFYQDFGSGGWRAQQVALTDSGNPFGNALIASQELSARQAEAESLAKDQLNQGNGYYPVVDTAQCNYPPDLEDYLYPDPNNKAKLNDSVDPTELANVQRLYCTVTTPGKTVADTASKAGTSAWDRLNVSGAIGKTMEGFSSESITNALSGTFNNSSGATGMAAFTPEQLKGPVLAPGAGSTGQ